MATSRLNVEITNATLDEAMAELLAPLNLEWVLKDETIVVKSRRRLVPKSPIPPVTQQQVVTGRVADGRQSLVGATVSVKGSDRKTTTDNEGNYQIEVPNNEAVLVFSSVGYSTAEERVGDRSVINVVLTEAVSDLDEVIIVGYGTVKKSDVTGSISSVSSAELNAYPAANVMQALGGRASGVQVKQNNGAPGAPVSIRIRGTNSIVGNNEPLYVVDGFPVSSPTGINNAGIENIEILKDASAVAIYGSRASNGVVLITTKKGKAGVSRISVNTSVGSQRLIKRMEMMNPEEYGKYYNVLYDNMGREPLFSDQQIAEFLATGEGTDWQDVVFRDDAPIQDHSLNISGGNDKSQFSITGSLFDQKGLIRNSGYTRYALNTTAQHKFNNAISIDLSVALSKNKHLRKLSEQGRFGTSLIGRAYGIPSTLPVYEEDGSYFEPVEHYAWVSEALYNPLNFINEQNDLLGENNVLANGSLSYRIIDGLVLKIAGGIESKNSRADFYQTKKFQNDPNGRATVTSTEYTSLLNENTLSYSHTWGDKHDLSAVAGFTYQDFLTTTLVGGGSSFLSDITESYNLGTAAVPAIPSTSYSKSVLLSGLGRVNYSFDRRYLFTVSFRADGSSIYSEGNKWGYFPSAAFAWRLSEEEFFQGVNFANDVKIRASWGKAGSQAISPYSTLNQLSPGTTVFGSSLYTTMAPSARLAADLKWETTSQWNVGLDWTMLNGRLQFTADYYNKRTDDLLNAVQLARSTGYTNSLRNIGSISNKGFEFMVGSDIISSDHFTWNLDANISFNRSKVLKLYGGQDILAGQLAMIMFTDWGNTYREGEPLGIMLGYQEDGYDENGFLQYKSDQKVQIGDPNPNFIFGINTDLSYKQFKLSMFFSGSQGNDIINMSAVAFTTDNTNGTSKLKEVMNNYWTPENPNAKYPVPHQGHTYRFSDRYVEDGSYIRLRNVELAYDIPVKRLPGVANAVIFLSGQNLLTFTKYSWVDPDVNSRGGGSSLDQGIDYATYPSAKSISGGLRLQF